MVESGRIDFIPCFILPDNLRWNIGTQVDMLSLCLYIYTIASPYQDHDVNSFHLSLKLQSGICILVLYSFSLNFSRQNVAYFEFLGLIFDGTDTVY